MASSVLVGFQSLGLGVVHHLVDKPENRNGSGTEPTLEAAVGLQSGVTVISIHRPAVGGSIGDPDPKTFWASQIFFPEIFRNLLYFGGKMVS